ncbi:MAG TPA: TrkH family potassium uptake protein [Afifellaceae bacterium]|nr:TrkH family potassium uptake protein [Afifellaceae bacterium]
MSVARRTDAPISLFDPRPILLVVGIFMAILGVSMLAPAFVDLALGAPTGPVFIGAAAVSIAFGLGLWAASRGVGTGLSAREAILMTALTWTLLPALGALPFYWSGITPTYTDAFFEAMSGITTTGATVITELKDKPPGILFWRAILQWLGGLGFVVMAVAVFPMLQIGGMQLFKTEAFDTAEKILPRATQISGSMTLIYVGLTALCAISYALAGMGMADAVMHSMTTVATGGFSSKDESIGYFNSANIDLIAIVFMILGSLPFIHFVQMVRGRPQAMLRDSQVRVFLMLIAFFTVILWIYKDHSGLEPGLSGLRHALFNIVSIMTGTGFATTDYEAWGPFATALFFLIMFIGGCAGSTSCGIKIFRFQVLFQELRQQISRQTYPHGIFIKRFNNQPIGDNVSAAVMSFFFLYLLSFFCLAAMLSVNGLDTLTAFSAAATSISNVGPGLGEIIGPNGSFKLLDPTSKWLLSAAMLLGRLELFTVLVIFLPAFWRT